MQTHLHEQDIPMTCRLNILYSYFLFFENTDYKVKCNFQTTFEARISYIMKPKSSIKNSTLPTHLHIRACAFTHTHTHIYGKHLNSFFNFVVLAILKQKLVAQWTVEVEKWVTIWNNEATIHTEII